jgi:hypothetical protein
MENSKQFISTINNENSIIKQCLFPIRNKRAHVFFLLEKIIHIDSIPTTKELWITETGPR